MLAGLIAPQLKPDGSGVSVSDTVPVKPFWAVTVMVVEADCVTSTAADAEAVSPKLTAGPKVKVAVADRVRTLSVPEIGKLKVPVTGEEHVTVAVPAPVTVPGVIAPQVRPDGTASDSVTVAVKPFNAATVMVEVSDVPAAPDGDVTATVKSRKAKVTVAVCIIAGVVLVPVMVTA